MKKLLFLSSSGLTRGSHDIGVFFQDTIDCLTYSRLFSTKKQEVFVDKMTDANVEKLSSICHSVLDTESIPIVSHSCYYAIMENIELRKKRLKKTGRLGVILQWVPFLRCLILNGSLAGGTAEESSDIDILVIAKSGRIYTTRFLINSSTALFGLKRSKNENKPHGGKFCFNYYLSTNFLIIPINRGKKMDQYCAENYSKSLLVWGKKALFEKFFEENDELFSLYCSKPIESAENFSLRLPAGEAGSKDNCETSMLTTFPIPIFHPMFIIGRILEFLLNGWWGDKLEKRLKRHQISRIEKDDRTKKYPDLIVYNDRELRFHPPKKESRYG